MAMWVKRLNKIIDRKFYEQITIWEGSQNAFASSTKKALVAILQEEAGEFFCLIIFNAVRI